MNFIDKLSSVLGISSLDAQNFLSEASLKYKVYKIPKRTHGFRIIAQPSKVLKKYQRAFLLICSFPSHYCAKGYKKNLNIADNAKDHVGNKYLLKLDLKDFFLKITPNLFWNESKKNALETYEELVQHKDLINQLIFWTPSRQLNKKMVLSIGAPSSPEISNFCLFSFDQKVFTYCSKHSIIYTRYADDLTFSCNEKDQLIILVDYIKEVLDTEYGGALKLNTKKTVLVSKACNRHVTGLTLTPDGKLSLGRGRKRMIKHLIHRYILGALSQNELETLRGWLAFFQSVEPAFILSLERKYTLAVLNRIRNKK